MFRLIALLLAIVSALTSGCAICSTPYDCHYAAYGGSNPRVDRVNGRVGSAFRDAGAIQVAPGVEVVDGIPFDGVPNEIFSEEVIDGQIIDGQIIDGEIINGDVIQQGEIIQGDAYGGSFAPNQIYDDTVPPESPIVELPSPDGGGIPFPDEVVPDVPQLSVPDAINRSISPDPPGVLEIPSISPSPQPAVDSLPNLDRVFDGLPPERHDATIQVLPSVIESPIR